jgi:hypothetical protein
LTETYEEYVDLDEIARQWPDGRDPPPLLADLARHVSGRERGALGAFRLAGDRLDDNWIENGADCWPHFGVFMVLPDGSRVAQWFRDGAADVPIVYLGSEGDVRLEAPNLEAFLAAWATATYDRQGNLVANGEAVSLPSELVRSADDEVADGRPAMAEFLRRRLGGDPPALIAPRQADAPIAQFFATWREQATAREASDPELRAIASALDAYVPRGKKAWERVLIDIRAAGHRFEVDDPKERKPLAEEEIVIPLVAAAREARAQGVHAVRGLWHTAYIELNPDGRCRLVCNWQRKPIFRDGQPPQPAEIGADLARFPRSARWLEPWMTVP